MSLNMGIGYEQALGLMYGLQHVVVDQMRTANAPNHGDFWAHNTTSSRGALFAEEAPTEKPKYNPKSTNDTQHKAERALARKKEREKATKITDLEKSNADLEDKVANLTESLKEAKLGSSPREKVPMPMVDDAWKGKAIDYLTTRLKELEKAKSEKHKEEECAMSQLWLCHRCWFT